MPVMPHVVERDGHRPVLCRSYTEAVWLAMLDALNITAIFEPDYFLKPLNPSTGRGFSYLPDIWLPEQNTFIECKGSFQGNEFQLTDPRCLWLLKNESVFETAREILTNGIDVGQVEGYIETWAVEWLPVDYRLMLFGEVTVEPDCYTDQYGTVVIKSKPGGGPLGLCPNCGKLGIFLPIHIAPERGPNACPQVDCQHCGMREAVTASRVGPLRQFLVNEIWMPFHRAAKYARSPSAPVYPAKSLDSKGLCWRYERRGTVKTIDVPEALFANRRI